MELQVICFSDTVPHRRILKQETSALQISASTRRRWKLNRSLTLTSFTVSTFKQLIYEIAENKPLDKIQTNSKAEDLPNMFGKSGTALGQTMPRSYNEFTKKFDNNYNKLGLRKWLYISLF